MRSYMYWDIETGNAVGGFDSRLDAITHLWLDVTAYPEMRQDLSIAEYVDDTGFIWGIWVIDKYGGLLYTIDPLERDF